MDRNVLNVSMWVVFIFGLLAMLVCLMTYFNGEPFSTYAYAGGEGALALFLTSVISLFKGKVK
jgi:hypothetical protein